jgi:hypothetical protein
VTGTKRGRLSAAERAAICSIISNRSRKISASMAASRCDARNGATIVLMEDQGTRFAIGKIA